MKKLLSGAACALAIGFVAAGGAAAPVVAQETGGLAMEAYESLMAQAKRNENPVAYDQALSAILERNDLTSFMRGRTLFERATRRWKDGMDKFGAVSDFEALLAMDPNHPFANNARIELGWAKEEIVRIEQGMNDLQTISEWFDGAFSLGLRDEAVARYRKSGISPTVAQVETMKSFGYLCDNIPGAPRLHHFGPERPDVSNVHWCGAAAGMPGPDIKPKVAVASAPAAQQSAGADGKNEASANEETAPAIAVAGP